jgi:hypothetical protein
VTDSVDGIDRRASQYRRTEHHRTITRATTTEPTTNTTPAHHREQPDATQTLGIPLFIMHTPPWNRQPWHTPQHPPTLKATKLDQRRDELAEMIHRR